MNRTPLYEKHLNKGAMFSVFGGYDMPLWYHSAKDEHINVINNVGIFDTSHMSVLSLTGENSERLLNSSFSRNITNLSPRKEIYGLFLTPDYFVIDDAVIYKFSHNEFIIVVNAGMGEIIIDHLKSFNFSNVTIFNHTNTICKIDVQGPKSLFLMEKIFGKALFADFPYYTFKGSFTNNDYLISRSGYTGELGFEIYCKNDLGTKLWDELLIQGEVFNIMSCGLASRDSLRVGANLPLSHQDFGNWKFCNTPWDFCVDTPIISNTSYTYSYLGYDVRKLKNSGVVYYNSEEIGRVLSCVSEVSLTRVGNEIISVKSKNSSDIKIKGLAAGFIIINRKMTSGDRVIISDGSRDLEVEIVESIRPERTARYSLKRIRSMYE
ncbi:MAG: hypothetical protein JXR64_02070 [Spirochaetales bacterium]|nr:hypothetical protein [Spirochaetales bacterium]